LRPHPLVVTPLTPFRTTALAIGRILLALALVLAAIHIFRLLILPAAQATFALGPDTISMLRRSGILLLALGAYWAYVRYAEQRKVCELHAAPGKVAKKIALAAAAGAVMILLVVLVLHLVGAYQLVALRGLQSGLIGTAYVILIAAMLEEIIYRGIIFRLLEQAWGTAAAMGWQALLFSVMHYANIEAGASVLTIATTMLACTMIGLMWTQIYVLSRNLWVCGANHAAWNFAVILSGAPLSGIEQWEHLAPVLIKIHGPDWLHGGAFGPENSIVAIVLTGLVLVALQRQINSIPNRDGGTAYKP
jgi:uncharacterized protein